MGEGVQVGKSSQGGITDKNVILKHFLCKLLRSTLHNNADWLSVDDVATNTINSLNAISHLRRPAFSSIFLLNNISCLPRHLLLQPRPRPSYFSTHYRHHPLRELMYQNNLRCLSRMSCSNCEFHCTVKNTMLALLYSIVIIVFVYLYPEGYISTLRVNYPYY